MSATKDARIKELEAEVVAAHQERDEARAQAQQATTETKAVTAERDEARDRNGVLETAVAHLEARLNAATNPTIEPAAGPEANATPATEGEPYAEEKDAMRRNGLSRAWVTPDGQVFYAERHAQEWAGSEEVFATLQVLTTE